MRIFLSFSHKDRHIADEVLQGLSRARLACETANLRQAYSHSANKEEQVVEHLRKFDHVIVLWSKAYAKDEWLQFELGAITSARYLRKDQSYLIPAMIDTTAKHGSFSRVVDLSEDIDEGIGDLLESIPVQKKVFVVMPIGDQELDAIYANTIVKVITESGLEPIRADQYKDSGPIPEKIFRDIETAGIIVADLTHGKPNVYLEVGYALGLGKTIILSARDGEQVHFDLIVNRRIPWKDKFGLEADLRENLKAILAARAR